MTQLRAINNVLARAIINCTKRAQVINDLNANRLNCLYEPKLRNNKITYEVYISDCFNPNRVFDITKLLKSEIVFLLFSAIFAGEKIKFDENWNRLNP